jgi:HEAT repeat protein
MQNYQKNDSILEKLIESLKQAKSTASREARIDTLTTEIANKCKTDPDLLDYLLDQVKDKDGLKKYIAIQALGKVDINDDRITKYLLKALSDKTNLEHYVGSTVANNSLTFGGFSVAALMSSATVGFFVAGPLGAIAGSIAGYTATKASANHFDNVAVRVYAAEALKKRCVYTQNISNALNARLTDPDEHQSVKDAAKNAIAVLQALHHAPPATPAPASP